MYKGRKCEDIICCHSRDDMDDEHKARHDQQFVYTKAQWNFYKRHQHWLVNCCSNKQLACYEYLTLGLHQLFDIKSGQQHLTWINDMMIVNEIKGYASNIFPITMETQSVIGFRSINFSVMNQAWKMYVHTLNIPFAYFTSSDTTN